MKKIIVCLGLSSLYFTRIFGQITDTNAVNNDQITKKITVGAYIDTYYGATPSKLKDNNIPYFVSMNRNNELNVNLAYLDFKYTDENVRARFVPGVGTYVNANYIAEPGTLKNIIEGNIGVRISKRRNIWIDAGVLGSPYTNESAISKDHLMYSRSFAPEYVPYYLSGVKATFPLSKKLTAYLYLLNGWQQIQDVNNGKSIGTQLEYRPKENHLINFNTYIGDERSVSSPLNRMRYFTDLYWSYSNPESKLSATSCVYVGNQKRIQEDGKQSNNYWWQVNFIGNYKLNAKTSLSGRIEYFNDASNVQITPVTIPGAFKAGSGGLCLNVKLTEQALFRLEGRQFFSSDKNFIDPQGNPSKQMSWFISNLTIWF